MASGTAVISSNVASLPEVAGDAALFFDPGEVDELVSHLHYISTDNAARDQLIIAGYNRVKRFSWDEAASSVYAILKKFA
jgi:glycosyltransferase involved in cell wall biosynthesis